VNVVLNYYLIPEFGVVGAAYATAISQAVVLLGVPVLFKATRPSVYDILWPFELGR